MYFLPFLIHTLVHHKSQPGANIFSSWVIGKQKMEKVASTMILAPQSCYTGTWRTQVPIWYLQYVYVDNGFKFLKKKTPYCIYILVLVVLVKMLWMKCRFGHSQPWSCCLKLLPIHDGAITTEGRHHWNKPWLVYFLWQMPSVWFQHFDP